MSDRKKSTKKDDGKLMQELLYDFKTHTDFTFEKITTIFNKILLYYDMKPKNQSTITRWCNKTHSPHNKYHIYLTILIEEYAPELLETDVGAYFADLYLTAQNITSITYEISEPLFKLFNAILNTYNWNNKTKSLYKLLINFYINLLKGKKYLYITFENVRYKIILPPSLRKIFLKGLTRKFFRRKFLPKVVTYFQVLYLVLQKSLNKSPQITAFLPQPLLIEFYKMVKHKNLNKKHLLNFMTKISVVKTLTQNRENKFLENFLQKCINLNFCTDVASECLSYYENHLYYMKSYDD